MQIIPLVAVPSQTLAITLSDQPVELNVYQRTTGMFVDLYVNSAPILTGAIGLNAVKIIRTAYLGFIGDLVFFDTQGSADPLYTGLGDRWLLIYLEPGDLP